MYLKPEKKAYVQQISCGHCLARGGGGESKTLVLVIRIICKETRDFTFCQRCPLCNSVCDFGKGIHSHLKYCQQDALSHSKICNIYANLSDILALVLCISNVVKTRPCKTQTQFRLDLYPYSDSKSNWNSPESVLPKVKPQGTDI